jgi:hypothetical protein
VKTHGGYPFSLSPENKKSKKSEAPKKAKTHLKSDLAEKDEIEKIGGAFFVPNSHYKKLYITATKSDRVILLLRNSMGV